MYIAIRSNECFPAYKVAIYELIATVQLKGNLSHAGILHA